MSTMTKRKAIAAVVRVIVWLNEHGPDLVTDEAEGRELQDMIDDLGAACESLKTHPGGETR